MSSICRNLTNALIIWIFTWIALLLLSTLESFRIKSKAMVPESKRIMVKLAASIVSLSNASRHKTELAANPMSAHDVKNKVFVAEIVVASMLYLILVVNDDTR